MHQHSSTLETALAYRDAGLSVISIRVDGTKRPALTTWAEYQHRLPTVDELAAWFGIGEDCGIAIIGGPVSGNLEIIDFDEEEAWQEWRAVALDALKRSEHRMPPLPVVETPDHGHHVYLRHLDAPAGNMKLTVRRREGKVETTVETRGAGGYVIAPGSPEAVHPLKKPYRLVRGDLGAVPTISAEARKVLHDTARLLSEAVEPERVVAPSPRMTNGERPGDIYARTATWDGLLQRHGWRRTGQHGGTGFWLRPSDWRGPGHSATTNHGGSGLLYVFSTNAHPFANDTSYSLFAAFALLEHGGDWGAAAKALAAAGYCKKAESQTGSHGLEIDRSDPVGSVRRLCRR